jgi:uncharacterized repeat protein (TIGR02543 family)
MRHNTFKLALAIVACLSVLSLAQLPVIRITLDREPTVSGGGMFGGTTTMNYVSVNSFELSGASNSNHNFTRSTQKLDSIRIRGNSTAQTAKKPYRIKFDKKVSLFGREAAKSWVLLADFYDGTFALNAIAFRLGQKMGLEFTHTAQHVELYINNQNKGIFMLTEQNQVNPGRVNIDEDKGWLVEFDYHTITAPEQDQVIFRTSKENYDLPTRIRSPELESNFNYTNPKVKFVYDDIINLTNKMKENNFPTNGYRDLMDLESWAKYVLIQQLIDNFDFNNKTTGPNMGMQDVSTLPASNYAYKDACGRIKAGPLWDFDLAAGVTVADFPRHYQIQEPIAPRHVFYKRLWADPVFLAKFKKAWDAHQNDFKDIPNYIDSISRTLGSKVQGNIWHANNSGMMGGGNSTLTQALHNTEVNGFKTWWSARLTHFGNQVNALNINTSQDITQPPLTCAQPSSSSRPSSSSAVSSSSSRPSSSSAVSSSSSSVASTFTVTFNANGGSNVQTQTVARGAKATKPADPTRNGFTFDGWYKDNTDFANAWNFDSDLVNANTTLYAKWKSITTFTVTFSMNGSGSAQPVPQVQNIAQGEKATRPATDPARNNYIFSGWYKEAETTTPWDFDTDVVNANTTIYAKWTAPNQQVTYTVTFNLNSNSAQPRPDAQTVNQGEKATKPADMTRNNYTFDGWYKDANFTTIWDFDSDVVNENITIYAKWVEQQQQEPQYPEDPEEPQEPQEPQDPQDPSFVITHKMPLGKSLTAIKNGLAISATSNVSITVFNLKGNTVRKHNFTQGNYTVKLDNLPKGMYIVRATFGNGATPVTIRLPIR